MRRHALGNVALIDGVVALLLLTLVYIGAGAMGSEIEGMEAAALDKIALENLREEIHKTVASMNMTSRNLDAGSFEIGNLRFLAEPIAGKVSQPFFVSDGGGVRVFYVTEKD